MTSPQPSVGRIVHYVSHGSADGHYTRECCAAIITETCEHPEADGTVGLAVLRPTGLFLNRDIPHAEDNEPAGGTWHWPERV